MWSVRRTVVWVGSIVERAFGRSRCGTQPEQLSLCDSQVQEWIANAWVERHWQQQGLWLIQRVRSINPPSKPRPGEDTIQHARRRLCVIDYKTWGRRLIPHNPAESSTPRSLLRRRTRSQQQRPIRVFRHGSTACYQRLCSAPASRESQWDSQAVTAFS
jgi:hypothetical protein